MIGFMCSTLQNRRPVNRAPRSARSVVRGVPRGPAGRALPSSAPARACLASQAHAVTAHRLAFSPSPRCRLHFFLFRWLSAAMSLSVPVSPTRIRRPPPCFCWHGQVSGWASCWPRRGRRQHLPPTGCGWSGDVPLRAAQRVLPTDCIGGHSSVTAAPICPSGKLTRARLASAERGGGSRPAPQRPAHSPLRGCRRAAASLARAGWAWGWHPVGAPATPCPHIRHGPRPLLRTPRPRPLPSPYRNGRGCAQ